MKYIAPILFCLTAMLTGCGNGHLVGTIELSDDNDTKAITKILSAVTRATKKYQYHWEKTETGTHQLYIKNAKVPYLRSVQTALTSMTAVERFTSPPATKLYLPPLPDALQSRMRKRNVVPQTQQAISIDWLYSQISMTRRSAADVNALIDSLVSALAPVSATPQQLNNIKIANYSYEKGVTYACRIKLTPKPIDTNDDSPYYRGVNTPFLQNYSRQYSRLSSGNRAFNDRILKSPSISSELAKIEDTNRDHAKIAAQEPGFEAIYAGLSFHPAGLGTADDEVHWNSVPVKFRRRKKEAKDGQLNICHNHLLKHAPPQLLAWITGSTPNGRILSFEAAKLANNPYKKGY